jgi:hypothetical protein
VNRTVRRSRRRQWIALILSGLFPGLGQLYLRAWLKGALFLFAGGAVTWTLGGLVQMDDLIEGHLAHPVLLLALLLALLALLLWSLMDAWRRGGGPPA